MEKKSQSKITLFVLFALILLINIFIVKAYSTASIVAPIPLGGSWSVNNKLFINVTPTISDYVSFASCGPDTAAVGANITQWNANLSVNWYPNGSVASPFIQNITIPGVKNGSIFQFNVSGLPESDSNGWQYRIILTNQSSGGATQNICGINYTEATNAFVIKVDNTTPVMVIDRPASRFNSTSSEVFFNVTAFDRNPNVCNLYLNLTGSAAGQNYTINISSSYSNGTAFGVTIPKFPDGRYSYFWSCTDLAGNVNSTNNVTFGVDTGFPVISLISPLNGTWVNASSVKFNFTVTDTNLNRCTLFANFTNAGNFWSSEASGNNRTSGQNGVPNIVSGVGTNNIFNASIADTNLSNGYIFALRCNDTIGNTIQSDNFTVYVDSVLPSAFTLLLGNRTTSNHHPNFTISKTVDANFEKYVLDIADDIAFTSIAQEQNYSGIVNLSGLLLTVPLNESVNANALTTYYWRVKAMDLAGNSRKSTNGSLSFTTDEVCYNLSTGYNYCGIVDEGLWTLAGIAAGSQAQNVYYWNNNLTASGFITYTAGLSANAQFNVTRGDSVVLYINSSGPFLWENRTWAISLGNATRYLDYNFTIHNNSGYHLLNVQNETAAVNFTRLWQGFMAQSWNASNTIQNDTMRYLSYVNNSKLRDPLNNNQFVPYQLLVNPKAFNAGTTIRYGETFWLFDINYTSGSGNTTKFPNRYWNKTLGTWG